MRVVFRCDASLAIGSGHVMRCLTLADALQNRGGHCHFICREHPGNLVEYIKSRGHEVHSLPVVKPEGDPLGRESHAGKELAHASWLGGSQGLDADECKPIIRNLQPGWLVVDHYALDSAWENAFQSLHCKVLVIDDLADRMHSCDIVIDQNLGRQGQDYAHLVPGHCRLLTGPQYALLRPEFAHFREYSLKRRSSLGLSHILISMGGVDANNATGAALEALKSCHLPPGCRVTVVMGATAPWLAKVREQVEQLPFLTEVVVNVSDMAQRMADSDLAIGAAGSTSWERCCLGVPTLMVVLARNQEFIAQSLHNEGAAINLGDMIKESWLASLKEAVNDLAFNPERLAKMSRQAARVVDGLGVERVVSALEEAT